MSACLFQFLPAPIRAVFPFSLCETRAIRSRIALASVLCLSVFVLLPHANGQTPEDALLNASNAEAGDAFGRSVAIDGDWAIVGTDFEDGPSDNTTHAGAAYVFERSGGTWQEVQVLRASNAGSGDEFGSSVAIDGDRAIVGAPYEGGPSDNTSRAGAAYVFERNGSTWQEVQILRASNLASDDQFGASVAIDGDRTIIGVPGENGPPNNLTFGGAAYVFEHSGSAWQQAQVLRASNAEGGDAFGRSVAIHGDRAIVGADFEDGPSDNTTRAGAAYVFERTDSGWNANEGRILRASNANSDDLFGRSVAIDGNRALVGVPYEDGPSNNTYGSGAAYLFERSGGTWQKAQVLRASDAGSGSGFGSSVAMDGGRTIVSRPSAAYVFERTTNGWNQNEDEILRASNPDADDTFGGSVAIDGNRAIVGAWLDDSNNPSAGAAYVYNDLTAPYAASDRARTSKGTLTTSAVLDNDSPVLGTFDPSSVQIAQSASGGTATPNADGTITYTPNGGFSGTDTFTYTVANQNGKRSGEATVTVSVLPNGYGAGRALTLDGTGDYVGLPNDPALNTGGPYEARTIELWFQTPSVSTSDEQVLYEEGGIEDGFNIYVKDGMLYAGVWSENNNWSGKWLSTSSVQSNTWHHVALVFDESNGILRAYLDGIRFGNKSPEATVDHHRGKVAIGASRGRTKFTGTGDYRSTGRYFEGKIDQVRLWNGALTQKQVRARAKRTIDRSAPVADSLIAAYRFDRGSGTTASDYSGDAFTVLNGTFNGNPDWAAFSRARLGDVSAAVSGGSTSLGTSGGTVTVNNVSTSGSDALQVYRYGRNDGPLIENTGGQREDFSGVSADRHLHVVWGLDAVGSSPSTDVTLDFSDIDGVGDPSSVRLLKREGPGTPWQDVTGSWTLDAGAQTFTKSGVSSFSQYAVGGTAQSLPVELVAFEAQRTESGVTLRWRTASEQNNAGFRLQRRTSGADENGWTTIGRRDGAGTTTQPQRYQFTDADLPYDADSLAYRLKQVDTDGSVHFSDPISVERGGVQQVQLRETYPNPASGQVTVRFAVPETAEETTRLTLYDVLGRKVRTVAAENVEGRAQRQVDVSGLSSGAYVLRLEAGGTVKTQRVTVVQ